MAVTSFGMARIVREERWVGVIPRVLEPESMDSDEEAREYDRMDHQVVNAQFVQDLIAAGLETGDVLDVGTGTALIPIELCRQHPSCRVVAADSSPAMLACARQRIADADLAARIELAQVDGKSMPFDDQQFDAVISNSIVHHIPEPLDVLQEMVRVARPGAVLFVRDLLRPASEETLQELVQRHAGQESEQAQKLFADSLRAALTVEEMRGLVAELGYDPEQVQVTSDRHWTWSTRC